MKRSLHSSVGGGSAADRRSIWTVRDVWLILPARTLALAGNAMAFLTLLLRVHDQGHPGWAIAVLLGCFAVPTIATMGLAGQLADRHDSRTLLTGGLLLQGAAVIGLALDEGLLATYLLVLVLELGQAITAPVWSALLPRVVGEERIGAAISWQQGLAAVGGPAGAALAGVLYQAYGGRLAFWVTAGTTLVLLVSAWAVRTRRHVAAEAPTVDPAQPAAGPHAAPARARWYSGVQILRHDALVWPLFLALMVMVVLVEGINAAEIFLARDELGASPAQYGFSEVAGGIGGIAGAVLAGRIVGDGARVRLALAGFGITCAALAVAGTAGSFWVYLGLVVVFALGSGAGNAANGALIMTRTADADRGKVQSGLSGVSRAAGVLALALGGATVTAFGPRPVFLVGGLAGVAVLAVTAWRLRASTAEGPALAPPATTESAPSVGAVGLLAAPAVAATLTGDPELQELP